MDQLERKLPSWCFALAVFSFIIIAESVDVTYEELRALNASCAPHDTCVGEGVNTVMDRNCECGPDCAVYGTCCIDSPYRSVSKTIKTKQRRTEVCTKFFRSYETYFMVTECHPRWYGSREVKKLCEQDVQDPSDPFVFTPASSIQRKKTYKNFFCGLCNNVEPNELKLWNLTLYYDGKEQDADVLTEQLVYNASMKEWGYWNDRNGKPYFEMIDLIPKAPPYLSEVSGWCIPNLVSECSPSWTDETVRRKCSAYLAALYVVTIEEDSYNISQFRNAHCAICNYQSPYNGIICSVSRGFPPSMSFTLLLDVNSSDGSRVGLVNRCKAGHSYDRFFKKCRSLECGLPGYVIERNRCVKST